MSNLLGHGDRTQRQDYSSYSLLESRPYFCYPQSPSCFLRIIIILLSPYKTIILQVLYLLNKILQVLFVIHTSSNLFNVNLILHPLHSVIRQFSHTKLSYLLMEIKLILIYWMMNILQSLMPLMKSQIRQPLVNFQHRLN